MLRMVSDRSFKWLGLFGVLVNNYIVHSVSCGDLRFLDPISISEKTCYRTISWTLEVARLVFYIITALWDFFWSASQISKQSDNIKYKSRGFETYLSIIRFIGYWNGALDIQEHTVFGLGYASFWICFIGCILCARELRGLFGQTYLSALIIVPVT